MTQHIRALTLAPEQMNRLYECGSYAKANDSTPDSSHLEKRVMEVLSSSPKPSVSKGELTCSLSKRQKASLDAALENLMASGKIKHRKGMKGGHWYSLT